MTALLGPSENLVVKEARQASGNTLESYVKAEVTGLFPNLGTIGA